MEGGASKNRRFVVKHVIGKGGCSSAVYKGIDQDLGREVAIKVELLSVNRPILEYEAKVMTYLAPVSGIPSIYGTWTDHKYRYLAMDYGGQAIHDLHRQCGGRFTIQSTSRFAKTALSIIEGMHNRYLVHRDIKPDNFLGKNGMIFLIDFGLAKRYVDNSGKHISPIKKGSFRGTYRFCSLNMHRRIEHSRRDDLESFGYVLVYLMKGTLPWQILGAGEKEVFQIKERISNEELCRGLPPQMTRYLQYVKGLDFAQDPDYIFIQNLFKDMLNDAGGPADYDWMALSPQEEGLLPKQLEFTPSNFKLPRMYSSLATNGLSSIQSNINSLTPALVSPKGEMSKERSEPSLIEVSKERSRLKTLIKDVAKDKKLKLMSINNSVKLTHGKSKRVSRSIENSSILKRPVFARNLPNIRKHKLINIFNY